MRDCGAPEFVPKLDLVLARLPGIVINQVPVCVYAIARKECRNHRVTRTPIGSDLRRIRHTGDASLRPIFALAFVIHIEERFVLNDGPAQSAAVLIIVKWTLRNGGQVEIVARSHLATAEKL